MNVKIAFYLLVILVLSGCFGTPTPDPVTLSAVDSTATSVTIQWTKNAGKFFSEYSVYRDNTEDVSRNSEKKVTITSRELTDYTNKELAPHRRYYYRVYVYNNYGNFAPGNVVGIGTTGLNSLTMGVYPRDMEFNRGEKVKIEVWIESVQELFGSSFELTYDTSVIDIDSLEPGPFLGDSVLFFEYITPETLSVAVTRKSGSEGVSGYGTLARIFCTVRGSGSCPLKFTDNYALRDKNGQPVNNSDSLAIWDGRIRVD